MYLTQDEQEQYAQILFDTKGLADEALKNTLENTFGTLKGYELYKVTSDTKAFILFSALSWDKNKQTGENISHIAGDNITSILIAMIGLVGWEAFMATILVDTGLKSVGIDLGTISEKAYNNGISASKISDIETNNFKKLPSDAKKAMTEQGIYPGGPKWNSFIMDQVKRQNQTSSTTQRINARINFIGLDELSESGTRDLRDLTILNDFSIYKLEGYSSVDSYYKFTILFVSDYDLVIEDIVDLECCVRVRDEINSLNKKEIYGRVFKIKEYSVVGSKRVYEVVLVSPLHYLSLNKHYEIYMDKSVKDIISIILGRYKALLGIDLVLKVDNLKYPIRHYTTQYAQSDYEFIKMLCEEEGLVLLSDYSSNNPYGLVLCELNEHAVSCDGIEASFFASKKFALSNYSEDFYDYLKPSVDMQTTHGKNLEFDTYKDNSYTKQLRHDLQYEILRDRLELYDGSNAKDLKRYNEIDAQRGYSSSIKVDGVSYELSMRDGISVVLNDTKLLQEKEVIILSVEYQGFFPNALDEYKEDDKDKTQYFVQFSSIVKDHIYRPYKTITKPRISSVQTAIVSKGDNNTKDSANEIDVNHLGEIRVIMHFDYNRPTSCYIPLSNIYSGDNYGARFLPRVNSEVIVSYINGDIDRPIIIGSLHNGENKIPYPLPQTKTQSYIKTQTTPQYQDKEGYNEILFEDKPNNEQLNLRAQKDHNVLVLNNSNETIQNNKTKFVQNNEKNTIKGNQSTHIHKNKSETINIASALTIGAGYQVSVGAGKNESVGGSSTEQVGILKHVIVGDKYTIGVGKSSITMYSNGNIIIQGEDIPIIGAEHIQVIAPRVYIDKGRSKSFENTSSFCLKCMLANSVQGISL